MSSKRNTESTERQARLAQVKAEQKRSDRLRTTIIAAVTGVVVLALAGTTIAMVTNANATNTAQAATAKARAGRRIDGVKTFGPLSRNHVTGTVDYDQNPPTGGDHSAVDQNCGFYSTPIVDENAVHSLEHGAVWITHDPDLPAAQVDILRELAAKNDYVLVSPRVGLPSPVVASAWGVQLRLPAAGDARLGAFLTKYVNGAQTPEPGAACTGGVGNPQ